ncbi:hypothetical protein A4D02_32275 [Niastella koreensis]|uniref:Uncharacterized protein n=2 Tax=Niastella koreensis TaxID=354356 RepID=G8TBY6_NIAKG|nr:hypothetical protein [Niastella koreensis]AEV99279.1 hypothetical protein Niako_2948 [Niastella koreensis GR20-10]OQP46068.1 hypothetical protein A4D02_32275 [Niastella koreensis]
MKRYLFLLVLVCTMQGIHAQYVYTIKADSVKITNTCDTAELIIENHTQTVPGFLFNKGRGRTEFRRGLLKINDSIFVVGGDTLRMNPWLQGGNRFGTRGSFGTMDNNSIDFYTNGTPRASLLNNGNLLIGYNPSDNGDKLQIGSKGAITFNANLSRTGDRIRIGGAINGEDGQTSIISASSDYGGSYRSILYERDGFIGIGNTSLTPTGALRLYPNGLVNVASGAFYMGLGTGEWNSSELKMFVSDPAEFTTGENAIHSRDNYYYFGTGCGAPTNNNVRANLRISGREIQFYSGLEPRYDQGLYAATITDKQNLLVATTPDRDIDGVRFHMTGDFLQEAPAKAVFGNALAFDFWNNASRINADNNEIVYRSANRGDQHLFINTIGSFFTGTLMTIDPGNNLDMPESQLALKVINKFNGPGFVVNMSGKVGIGTLFPTASLHAAGTIRFPDLTPNNSLTHIVVADASGNLYYKDAASTFNGAMNSDLAVNGTVSAQKMLISQTGRWPDYVFSKKYQLPSLAEVEKFINQNNHLPGIPSAAEVEKKGIDVANNQAGLLKKIEELTLYAIEQEKKLQKQSEEINELKNQNKEVESLKRQIAELRSLIISASQSEK